MRDRGTRRRLVVAGVGWLLVGLVLAGLALKVVAAMVAGEPFYGRNVYHQPLGTYPSAAVLLVAAVAGVVWCVRRLRR